MEEFTICRGERHDPKAPGRLFCKGTNEFIFKAHKDLYLKGLTFFGPHQTAPEISNLKVNVQIEVSSVGGQTTHDDDKILSKSEWNVEAIRGEKFMVQFEKPVVIPALIWLAVKFTLQGPKTEYLLEKRKYDLVHCYKDVRIDCLIGSLQLSDLHFRF